MAKKVSSPKKTKKAISMNKPHEVATGRRDASMTVERDASMTVDPQGMPGNFFLRPTHAPIP